MMCLLSCICPVMSYGAAVWGDKTYSCINAVWNIATDSFYTPNAAVPGNMEWSQSTSRQFNQY